MFALSCFVVSWSPTAALWRLFGMEDIMTEYPLIKIAHCWSVCFLKLRSAWDVKYVNC